MFTSLITARLIFGQCVNIQNSIAPPPTNGSMYVMFCCSSKSLGKRSISSFIRAPFPPAHLTNGLALFIFYCTLVISNHYSLLIYNFFGSTIKNYAISKSSSRLNWGGCIHRNLLCINFNQTLCKPIVFCLSFYYDIINLIIVLSVSNLRLYYKVIKYYAICRVDKVQIYPIKYTFSFIIFLIK